MILFTSYTVFDKNGVFRAINSGRTQQTSIEIMQRVSYTVFQDSFSWCFTGAYSPHTRRDKAECWEEIAAIKGMWDGPWVTCGDFKTNRYMGDRRNITRSSNIMREFSDWMDDMELNDSYLNSGRLHGFRGVNHNSAARLDKFLLYGMGRNFFSDIQQNLLPRANSDHTPSPLECGNWI